MPADPRPQPTAAPPAGAPDDVAAAYRQLYAFVEDLRQVVAQRDEALAAAHASERAKAEFLASLSAELLNPLTTILGFGEAMLANARDAEQRDHLSRILKAATSLEGVIHKLLAVARVPG